MAFQPTLFLAALSTLLVASAYFLVGLRLGAGRSVANPAERALRFFALWWLATAVNQYLGSGIYFAASFGFTDLTLQLSYTVIQRGLLALSLVGLMHYLLYLLTGREALRTLLVVYGLFFAIQLYGIFYARPVGIEEHGWRTTLDTERDDPAWAQLTSLVCIVLPPVFGSLGLARLVPRTDDRSRRARLLAVSAGILVWWVVAVLAGQPGTFDLQWFQIFNRALGLTVALTILFAYQPTAWMRRRLGIQPYRST